MRIRQLLATTLFAFTVLAATPAHAINGAGTGDCPDGSGGTLTGSFRYNAVAGLKRLGLGNTCTSIYALEEIRTADDDIRIAIAPGAVRNLGHPGLAHIGLYGIHPTSIGAPPGWHIMATTACFYPDVDYLIRADGHVVINPCG
jgi:hypothetical protein